jgi:ribosome-associated heat shock protein Hsp15
MRIDKWLWAARFYKTRSLAAQAIAAGHVRLAGQAVKAARELHVGDEPRNRRRRGVWSVVVRGLNAQRRPASRSAAALRGNRGQPRAPLAQQEARQLAPVPGSDLRGRPTKKARRQIRGFNEGL